MLTDYTSFLQLIFLSIVQGFSELLPISSSGHLVLTNILLNSNYTETFFLTILHLGTTFAIVIYFFKDLLNILRKPKLIITMLIASIPAAVIGVLFNRYIEEILRAPIYIAISLIIIGIVMILTEKLIKNNKIVSTKKSLDDITYKDAIIVGLTQSLALIPGVSRSGITTLTGIYSEMDKDLALSFSFILGIPILFGSFFFEFIDTPNAINIILTKEILLSVITTCIVGYLSILLLRKYVIKYFLTLFGYYRIILGILIIILISLNYI